MYNGLRAHVYVQEMHDVMMYCVYVHAKPYRLCCEHIYASSSHNVLVVTSVSVAGPNVVVT